MNEYKVIQDNRRWCVLDPDEKLVAEFRGSDAQHWARMHSWSLHAQDVVDREDAE